MGLRINDIVILVPRQIWALSGFMTGLGKMGDFILPSKGLPLSVPPNLARLPNWQNE